MKYNVIINRNKAMYGVQLNIEEDYENNPSDPHLRYLKTQLTEWAYLEMLDKIELTKYRAEKRAKEEARAEKVEDDRKFYSAIDEAVEYEEEFLQKQEAKVQQVALLRRVPVVNYFQIKLKGDRKTRVCSEEIGLHTKACINVIKKSYKKKKLNKCNERTSF